MDPTPFFIKTIISQNEFLLISWTGTSELGLFITGDGDPVRGTLEWPIYPEVICLDYPYILSLLPNNAIEVHSVETQQIMQVINTPPVTSPLSSKPSSPSPRQAMHQWSSSTASKSSAVDSSRRINLVSSIAGYLVPSMQRSEKMSMVPVKLLRT